MKRGMFRQSPLVPKLLFGNTWLRSSVSAPDSARARNRSFGRVVPKQEFGTRKPEMHLCPSRERQRAGTAPRSLTLAARTPGLSAALHRHAHLLQQLLAAVLEQVGQVG